MDTVLLLLLLNCFSDSWRIVEERTRATLALLRNSTLDDRREILIDLNYGYMDLWVLWIVDYESATADPQLT